MIKFDHKPDPIYFYRIVFWSLLLALSKFQELYYPDLIHPALKIVIILSLVLPTVIKIDDGNV